jgi:valyl-tRNA synthetase
MASRYESDARSDRAWYNYWEASGFFRPARTRESTADTNRRKFSMILPPPNVTGELHVGHALTVAIQDALVRRQRMLNREVVWVPGLDHAGIATQAVVERQMARDGLGSRQQVGREAFEELVWQWCETYKKRITEQLRSAGASLDWEREFFSLDAARTSAVDTAFVRLFDAGLVYRSDRLVNWCCALQTVVSDIEVDSEEIQRRTALNVPNVSKPVEFGVLHTVAFATDDGTRELLVATTRPETMFADVALAVHPDDARYAALVGAHVTHPLTRARLPVIADAELVDREFGTGVVKVSVSAAHACMRST